MSGYDVLVIGGGMAGASIGYEIAADHSVGLLDMESTLAYHTTGRSAAVFVEVLGSALVRGLTLASREHLSDGEDWFDSPAMKPLPSLIVATPGDEEKLRAWHAEVSAQVPDLAIVDATEVLELNPVLRSGYYRIGAYEPRAMEMDVHTIHSAYLRGLRRRAGKVHPAAPVVAATRAGNVWRVVLRDGSVVEAETVVNAAGAWADEVARIFRVAPVGITPLRRSMFGVRAPEGCEVSRIPLTNEVESRFYFKPEGDGFICSPVDETPHEPADAKADPLEIARALDALGEATVIGARSVRSEWGGLRSFVADRHPVVGFDSSVDGFFWYAGQGGYGIQTAPALSRVGAALLAGRGLPDDVAGYGVTAEKLSPHRPELASARAGRGNVPGAESEPHEDEE
ncbi:FAD-binding oxidoreductase [Actinomadura madurae]|uniref:Glycine/D-amino acid oxidase n=1 Tax=Actinomadura madurae TaxID=1993 RepID=A0A1I5I5J1_9ACTN|nr:FAD-dependent oxidoreductase [Actinomadura madurae]SFO55842.1 Glycine/D-amino acid oxidase [Actinomadura madurae]